jgi:hypothetical protein
MIGAFAQVAALSVRRLRIASFLGVDQERGRKQKQRLIDNHIF